MIMIENITRINLKYRKVVKQRNKLSVNEPPKSQSNA